MLASCASGNQPINGTGYATTDDGVQIHYRLLGPKDAPVIWVGYPWTKGWSDVMEEIGAGRYGEEAAQQIIAGRAQGCFNSSLSICPSTM